MADDPEPEDDELNEDLVEDGEGEDEDEDDIVILTDAEGNEVEYEFLAIVDMDGEQYALLTPHNDLEDEEEATEIFIFHYRQDEDGGEVFADVTDEETFKKVQERAEALLAADGDDEN